MSSNPVKMQDLTPEDRAAIQALHDLAKIWPSSTLWLFSASGRLNVMRCGPDGQPVFDRRGSVDRAYVVDVIQGIPNDGGDW